MMLFFQFTLVVLVKNPIVSDDSKKSMQGLVADVIDDTSVTLSFPSFLLGILPHFLVVCHQGNASFRQQ